MKWGIIALLLFEVGAARAEPVAMSLPGPPVMGPEEKRADEPVIREDMLKLRDPFRVPESADAVIEGPKNDLEKYSIEEFKLLGVSTGPNRIRALIKGPNGKTYFVGEKTKIGVHKGMVSRISPDVVLVKEKVVNALGQEELIEGEIRQAQ